MAQGREESEFKLVQPDGTTKIYRVVPFVTIDDILNLGAKNVAAEIKLGKSYTSPGTREVRDQLILTEVTNRS